MPPRKSNVSTAGAEDDGASATASSAKEARDDTLSIEDLNLPKSIVQRLAKGVLPANTSIQKDALLAISKSATVFVNYLTSCAADHAGNHGKKTVMPFHVYEAMQQLEFSFMLPRLEAEVAKFTSIQSDKRNTYRKKVREEKKAAAAGATAGAVIEEGDTTVVSMAGDGDEPAAKKVRLDREAETGDEEEGEGDMGDGVDGEDEEVEDDEIEEEEQEEGEGLVEDLLEEKEEKEEDDEMADGDESD